MISRLALFVSVVVSLAACAVAQDRLRVGVWNIERLSATAKRGFPELKGDDQFLPRTGEDLQAMAEYIRDDLKVDALMISEIDADSPLSTQQKPQSKQLNQVAQHLGSNWKYFLGRSGDDLRLGLLFNTDRVKLKKLVNLDAREFPVSGKDILDRDPFIVWIAAREGGTTKNDVLLICVHLKSQQKPYKDNRMAAIAKLIGDYKHPKTRDLLTLPSLSEEPEVLILGDCNDSSFNRSGFKYMFDYLNGVGFSHIRNSSGDYPHTRVNGSQIDHLFGSEKVMDDSMIPGSFEVHTVPGNDEDPPRMNYRKSLSDHFPVTVDLKWENDLDFTISEALATTDPDLRRRRMAALQEDAFERAARAMDVQSLEPDDDDEVLIEFDVRDDNFDEILAPSSPAGPDATVSSAIARADIARAGIAGTGIPAQPSNAVATNLCSAPTAALLWQWEVAVWWCHKIALPNRICRLFTCSKTGRRLNRSSSIRCGRDRR